MKGLSWSEEDVKRAVALRESGLTYRGIAESMRRSLRSVQQMFVRQKEGTLSHKRTLVAWTEADVRWLKNLLAIGRTPRHIAKTMGRTYSSITAKMSYLAQFEREAPPRVVARNIPPETERVWRERQSLKPQSLTASLCGDPLPGYSALERRP